MTFDELNFKYLPGTGGGRQAIVSFPNGYGASIVRGSYTYGGDEGLYELAVLKDGHICYDTDITQDVIGWLNSDDVTRLLKLIEVL